ncbi:RNA methyltransferase [Minwuia sp.]|uniref:RNA methyltransferase n=1 Tax=Minwuia sp. TaxID=2493630 RepID=UPI003A94ABB5
MEHESVRGYFGIGVWRFSKPMNAGNLFRTAHAFGASFVFTIDATYRVRKAKSDTSAAPRNIPWYEYDSPADFQLPNDCKLVGVELTDDAIDLPRFHHPKAAAYVLGPERGSIEGELLEKCDHIVRIPTKFCINVATAGAIVMYDRVMTHGQFGVRPLTNATTPGELPQHRHGGPVRRHQGK